MTPRPAYPGPALFSYGFRPFFLAAALFGLGVVPLWLLVWQGRLAIPGPFQPVDWHVHEMIFGYAAAVMAGFLFTAVPNWTGRLPTRGWPLMTLVATWVAGRLAVAGLLPLSVLAVAAVDCAFLLAIGVMTVVEIVAGRNWRNLMVVVPVGLLFAANVTFHAEATLLGGAAIGRRLGLSVILFLVMLVGGRIIPSFTRNWLAKAGASRMPVPFGRFDGVCLGVGGIALLGWSLWGETAAGAVLLLLAAALHAVRLARWRGPATWRAPLLLMLHLAYAFLPAGLLALSAAGLGLVPAAAGLHLLGIGGVGGMTVAVMIRATRGHTGRSLDAGPALTAAFGLIAGAALLRAGGAALGLGGVDGITLAALAWTAGFALLSVRLAPWLARPAVAPRRPNPAAAA
ncbi:NnrS family protein [Wenxinia marina]|uniref:Uncharacterized protein involved in response to NO n=1 Tax=Wenxinia marina DSM 24838 TaxID=1123501 RepID=A0A0D0PFY2_9RHOB|nr:Uncharacterized protein involved in response to NO [Wenxinia marina DSM 24838]GGL50313.1 short-chain dehydrogenase [Wenxinia marina]